MKSGVLPKAKKVMVVPFLILLLLLALGGASAVPFTNCGPFTDVGSLICPFVLELYYSGITAGTSATTYSPNDPVTRGQMAVFTSTALDLSLARSSRRAALNQWWTTTPHYDAGLGLTTVGTHPCLLESDGADVWVANNGSGTVSRVRASDGALIGTWTGAAGAFGVLVAMGRIFVTGDMSPGSLYMIDPTQVPGAVTTVSNSLGNFPNAIVFDGASLWTANSGLGAGGSVSKITPGTSPGLWTVTTFTTGFSQPTGAVFSGANVWVTDGSLNALIKLNSDGSVAQSVPLSGNPSGPAYDGRNIWVPGPFDNSLTVVRASDGVALQTFSAANGNQNGLSTPTYAAFNGELIVVTNQAPPSSVSVFKAADLSPKGSVGTPGLTDPIGIASDGLNFWIGDYLSGTLARF